MKAITTKQLVIIAISAAVVITAVMLIGENQGDRQSTQVAEPQRTRSPTTPMRPATGLPPPEAAPPVRNVDRTTKQSMRYFESEDLKSLVNDARADPTAASYYYATLALRECESTINLDIGAVEEASNLGGPKREALLSKAKKRCKNVTHEDLASLRKLGDEGLAAKDVGFAAVRPVSSTPRAFTGPTPLIEALYKTTDAGIALTVLQELASYADALQIGDRTMSEAERSSLPAALLLLGCDIGVPCDTRHPHVFAACIGHGRCEDTLPALLQRTDSDYWAPYTRGVRFDYNTALALKEAIVTGIVRGDREALRSR